MTDTAAELFYAALLEDDADALYERAPCGYLSTRPDGLIVKVNETLLALTGYERDALVGRRTFASLLSAGGRIFHETHYAPMLQLQGRAREIALELVAASGDRIPVLVNSIVERDADNAPRVIRTAVFDATERRAYERELVEAKERAERSEARASLIARTLQYTLLPHSAPEIPGLDVAASYRPAGAGDEIGGDFYDVFEAAPDDWIVMVGDVCGKGVAAATVAAVARYAVRGAAVRQRRPADILSVLNQVLLQDESDRFCTAVVVRLRRRDDAWAIELGVAGHPSPLHVVPDRSPTPVGMAGPLLGVFPDASYGQTEIELGHTEAVVLFTDGVTEGRRDADFYGDERLATTVHEVAGDSATALVERITTEVVDFQRSRPRDDIVVVAVRNA